MFNDINLIPDKIIYKRHKLVRNTIRYLLAALLALLIVSTLSYRTYQRWELEKRISQTAAGIDISSLDELKKAEDMLISKQDEISELDATLNKIPTASMKVSELIQSFSALMPPSVIAEKISFQYDKTQISVDLLAKDRENIALFLKRLHDDSLFSSINISEITGEMGDFRFSVTAEIVK